MPAQVESIETRRRARQAAAARERAPVVDPTPQVVAQPLAQTQPQPSQRAPEPERGPEPQRDGARAADLVADLARQLWRQFNPEVLRALNDDIAARLRRMPTRFNEYGFDPWGFNVDAARRAMVISALLYRHYFRVETHGIEHVPNGRVLVISNHAGQVAIDAAMIGTATLLEREPPRILRGMGEYWLPTVPFVNLLMSRTGSVVGTPKNCADLLRVDEAVIAFPEGVRGMNKLFSERYRLQPFGSGFMRMALLTKTPIVPVAVVGSEEQAPSIANFRGLARMLGMPAFPITLTFPLLGPLGLVPLPVKYRIYFGKPMRFEGNPDDEDAVIERKVARVVNTIQSMLDNGLRERAGIFY